MTQQEKIAPASPEAEEAVLGSILINPGALPEVAAFLTTNDFFIVRNGWVWTAMLTIQARGDALDNLTLAEELRAQGKLNEIGGSAYLIYLVNNTPTHIHAETYARIVERAAMRRRLLAAAGDIAQIALEDDAELADILDRADATLFKVTEKKADSDMLPLHYLVDQYYDQVERLQTQHGPVGLPTGFSDLDRIIGGLRPANLIIVGARPGVGKTALMLNIATNVARQRKTDSGSASPFNIAIFSMEMGCDELMERLAASESKVDSRRLQQGDLNDDEWGRFTEATGRMTSYRMFIDESTSISVNRMRAKCRRLVRDVGHLDLILVDYLQLMDGDRRSDNRTQEVGQISRGLKRLAREFRVPVMAAAQLSRALEQRQDKRPQLSDLRESGDIEADADVVMLLYRPDMYDENSERQCQTDVIVAKNRKGPLGVATLYFQAARTQFANMHRATVDLSHWSEGNGHH